MLPSAVTFGLLLRCFRPSTRPVGPLAWRESPEAEVAASLRGRCCVLGCFRHPAVTHYPSGKPLLLRWSTSCASTLSLPCVAMALYVGNSQHAELCRLMDGWFPSDGLVFSSRPAHPCSTKCTFARQTEGILAL